MAALCAQHDLTLDLSTTHYVDHWITPIGEKRRFDTRFFVTTAPVGQAGLHDNKETDDSLWVRPSQALQMHAAGELAMLPPTIANMRELARHQTAASAVAAGAAKTDIPSILPKIQFNADGKMIGIIMPGEPGYDDIV